MTALPGYRTIAKRSLVLAHNTNRRRHLVTMNEHTHAHFQVVRQLTAPGAPFEIEERVIGGVAFKAYRHCAPDLRTLMAAGRQHGDRVFVQYPGYSLSYTEFWQQVDALAAALQHHYKIAQGSSVAIAMRNRPEWLVAFTAIIQIGAVVVPLNSWGKGDELVQGLTDSEAELLIADAQRLQYVRHTGHAQPTIVVEPDGTSDGACDDACDDNSADWQQIINTYLGQAPEQPPIAPTDPAILLFTSGTSGRPKGALFNHFNCCQSLMNVEFIGASTYMTNHTAQDALLAEGTPPKTLLAVPLFHISGLFSQFIINLRHGRGLYIMYKWDANEALRLLREEGITVLMGAPAMLLELLSLEDFSPEDAAKVANISAGGAGTPDILHGLYLSQTPRALPGAGWGMTETGGTGAAFTGRYAVDYPGASGFPSPIVEFSFHREDGGLAEAGEPGEVWIKSSAAIQCYRTGGSPDDVEDGWLKTGDVGYLSDAGLLYLCGRVKDMVIRGGENIYPAEVEACLLEFPGCVEAAVVGLPSQRWGEELAAVIRLRNDASATAEAIRSHCGEHLAGFKVPEHIVFADEPLARNAVNKLLKAEIRQTYFAV